jgi:hypothetical protein
MATATSLCVGLGAVSERLQAARPRATASAGSSSRAVFMRISPPVKELQT